MIYNIDIKFILFTFKDDFIKGLKLLYTKVLHALTNAAFNSILKDIGSMKFIFL